MSKTVLYYNCFITYNGEYTNLPLEIFLDNVRVLKPERRFRNIPKTGALSMLGMMAPNPKKNPRFRKVTIGKYRDEKPYEGQKGKDIATLIKNDVVELTSMLYIPESYLVCMEYNHYGPRVNNIENYLRTFLPYDDDNKWGITFIPVESNIGFTDIKNSNDIRQIEFKLNLRSNTRRILENKEQKTILEDLFSKVAKAKEGFGANTSSIVFGNGRKRKKEEIIQAKQLIHLIENMDREDDLYESIKVTFVHKGKTIKLDLKNEGILKRSIMENDSATGWEYICNEIESDFLNGRPGKSKWVTYKDEMIDLEMPDINKDYIVIQKEKFITN